MQGLISEKIFSSSYNDLVSMSVWYFTPPMYQIQRLSLVSILSYLSYLQFAYFVKIMISIFINSKTSIIYIYRFLITCKAKKEQYKKKYPLTFLSFFVKKYIFLVYQVKSQICTLHQSKQISM